MSKNRIANLLSWIAILVGVVCLCGLLLAGALVIHERMNPEASVGLAFLIVTTWLSLVGAGGVLFGGLSAILATGEATRGQSRRARFGWMIGLVALAVGLSFGVILL